MRISDWGSAVCSSDLGTADADAFAGHDVVEWKRAHGNPQPRIAPARFAPGQVADPFDTSCEHETFSSRWAMKNVPGHAAARGKAARCCLLDRKSTRPTSSH